MKEAQNINSIDKLEEILQSKIAVLLYFNTISCNVGESLEPKVKNLLISNFPKISFYTIDINFLPKIAANSSDSCNSSKVSNSLSHS
jgi:hypothetical protein